MKKILSILVLLLALAGCHRLPIETTGGKEDVGYVMFISESGKTLGEELTVVVDDNTTFTANAVAANKAKLRGNLYGLATGSRKVVVKDAKGNVLYSKTLFISSQETKQISLQ